MLDFSLRPSAISRPRFVSKTAISLGILLALIATPQLMAQTATPGTQWTKLSPATPSTPSDTGCMAYDAANGTIVRFGGYLQDASVNAQTWVWSGGNWTQSSAIGPPAAFGCGMAYMPSIGKVIMFGGATADPNNITKYGDTWAWNGSTWTNLNVTGPDARYSPAMAYDPAIGKIVLFGGYGYIVEGDTWTFNGTSWTQVSTGPTVPTLRFDSAMAYHEPTGKIVLFGGYDESGSTDADTWLFNGSTWTQASPATVPPARYGPAMAYDPAIGSIVMFGGDNTTDLTTNLGDTWAWNGTNWTSLPTGPTASQGSEAAYYAPGGYLLQFGGFSNAQNDIPDTWALTGPAFTAATTAVGSPSASVAVNFSITGSGTLGSITNANVLTQGAPGLDFTLGSTSGCGAVAAGQTCTVNVLFKPTAPGLRSGAVNLKNSTGTVIATAYISGTGTGPLFLYGAGSLSTTYPAIFSNPRSPAVDGSGNLYLANSGSTITQLLKIPSGSTTASTVSLSTSSGVTGVAVDGAGNVFFGLPISSGTNIYELVGGTGSQMPIAAIPDNVDNNMSIDGAGNLYVSGASTGAIFKIASGSHTVSTLLAGGSGARFIGMTIDAKGNLFAADFAHNTLSELAAGASSLTTLYTGSPLSSPDAVAIDAAGNIYVSNYQKVVTYRFAAGSYSTTPTTLSVTAGESLTLSSTGTMYTSVGNALYAWNRSSAPPLSFPTTAVNGSSATQTLTFENDGNAGLIVPIPATGQNPSLSAGFTISNSSTCPLVYKTSSVPQTLPAASTCTEILSYTPTIAGATTGNLVFTDNNLTATTSKQTMVAMTGSTSSNLTMQVIGQNIPSGTTSITLESIIGYGGNGAPTSTPTLTVNGSTTGVGTITCLVKSGHNNCTATYNPSSLSPGAYPIVATSPAGGAYATPATATAYLTILGNSSHITAPVLQANPIAPVAAESKPVAPSTAIRTSTVTPAATPIFVPQLFSEPSTINPTSITDSTPGDDSTKSKTK